MKYFCLKVIYIDSVCKVKFMLPGKYSWRIFILVAICLVATFVQNNQIRMIRDNNLCFYSVRFNLAWKNRSPKWPKKLPPESLSQSESQFESQTSYGPCQKCSKSLFHRVRKWLKDMKMRNQVSDCLCDPKITLK